MSKKDHTERKPRKPLSVESFKSHAAEEVLKAALEELGWENVTAASSASCKAKCDIYWRGVDRGEPPVPESSYVARIPGMSSVAHKSELSRHINRLRQFFPGEFSFYPQTWLLPEDQESFEAYAQSKKGKKKTYIVKPDEGAQGEGIFLIQHPRDLLHLKQPSIVQKYVTKPLLIRGLKFDLRLYVLIASLDPLEVYLSDSGMVRFCTVPYSPPSIANMHETFMHLTNYSLNKRSKEYVHSERSDEGSKQTLDSIMNELERDGHDVRSLWDRVRCLVCKTVFAVLPQLMVEGKSYTTEHSLRAPVNGFQVIGIDVLIDRKLRPHLLEVNAHPSLRVDFEQPIKPGVVEYVPSPVDMAIKLPVVKDSLKVIGAKVKGHECDVEGTRFTELLPSNEATYSHLRIFERCARLYGHFLGVRGGVKMGSSSFRSFVRQCKLCSKTFTSADVDILFIEVSRRRGNSYERNALSLNGFCEALMLTASKTVSAGHGEVGNSLTALDKLLEQCERESGIVR